MRPSTRDALGAIAMAMAGLVLLPIGLVAVLLMRPRNVEPWRPMPPPR